MKNITKRILRKKQQKKNQSEIPTAATHPEVPQLSPTTSTAEPIVSRPSTSVFFPGAHDFGIKDSQFQVAGRDIKTTSIYTGKIFYVYPFILLIVQ